MKSQRAWMKLSRPTKLTLGCLALLTVSLSGCLNLPQEDRAPRRPPDVSSVPDATPREEPRSRYGNPASYEVFGKTYSVMESAHGYKERGVASWYGEKFHGRRTSSGEPYDMYAMTAAHKSLPLPTYVRVTNLRNRASVIVRVNDRGPFVHNRIIDLSYTAAKRLDILSAGTALVEVEALTGQAGEASRSGEFQIATVQPPPPIAVATATSDPVSEAPDENGSENAAETPPVITPPGSQQASSSIFVQLGAFADPLNAEALLGRLQALGFAAARITADPIQGRMVYRVRIGPLANADALADLDADLAAQGISGYHVAHE